MADSMAVYGLKHQYARLAGDKTKLKSQNGRLRTTIAHHHARIAESEAMIAESEARIAENDARIATLTEDMEVMLLTSSSVFQVDISQTLPRQTKSSKRFAGWGSITRGILEQLKLETTKPLTTLDLAFRINEFLGLGLGDADLANLRQSIRYRMKELHRRGWVIRVSKAGGIGKTSKWAIAPGIAK